MKYIIILLLGVIVTLSSCSNNTTIRAIDASTGMPAPVSCDTSFYKSGDTVWVDIRRMEVTCNTSNKHNTSSYRKFVIQ